MADFAELVTRFSSTGYDEVASRLDGLAAKAAAAGRATQSLTRALQDGHSGTRSAMDGLTGICAAMGEAAAFLESGIQSNDAWERSAIGIASAVAATHTLADAQGNVLTGQDACNAALTISEQAMNRLRIASLETSATTEDLASGFRQLLGPATAAGLDMERTLALVTRTAQAADALGVPFSQLSAETRSLLEGAIDPMRDRLAATLGITGDMARGWKEQGVLAQELLSRIEPYAEAGKEAARTWSDVASNMQKALAAVSADMTKGLYENLKTAGQEFTAALVNADQGKASDAVSNLAGALEGLSDSLGEGVLEGTRDLIALMAYLNDNLDAIRSGAAAATGAFAGWAVINRSNLLPALAEASAAISRHIGSCTEAAQAARLAAEAEVAHAAQGVENALAQEKTAQAAYARAKAAMSSAVSSRQARQASAAETAALRELLAAQTGVQAQTDRLSAAQANLSKAAKNASVSAKAASVVGSGLKSLGSGLLGALGGPVGASLTVLGAGAAYLASKQTEAEKAAALHARSLETLNRLSSDASRENKTLGDNLGAVAEARRNMALDEQAQALAKFAGSIKLLDFSSATGFLPAFREQASELDAMADAVLSGEERFSSFQNALAVFYNELKESGEESSRLGERIKKALDLAEQGVAAETVLRALRGETVAMAGAMNEVATASGKAGSAIAAAFDPQKVRGVLESLSFKAYAAGLTELQTAQAQALRQAGKTTEEIQRLLAGQDRSPEADRILRGASDAYRAEQRKKAAEEALRRAQELRQKAEAEARATQRAMDDLQTEVNRLSLPEGQFREYQLEKRLAQLRQEIPEAVSLISRFEQATRQGWEDEDAREEEEQASQKLQSTADFYQKLAALSGDYGASTAWQNQLLEEQARLYTERLGPGHEKYVAQWKELMRTQNSRDGWDGARRALISYYSEATDMAKGFEGLTSNALSGVEDAFVRMAQTGKLSFSDMVNSMMADLIRLTVRASITGPLADAISSGIQSLFNPNADGAAAASARGGSFYEPWSASFMRRTTPLTFASGGVASPSRGLPASGGLLTGPTYFHDGMSPASARSGLSVAGEAGPEVFMPAVPMSDGKYGVRVQGMDAPQVNIQVVNQTGTEAGAEVRQQRNSQGGVDVMVLLKREMASDIARGGVLDQTIRGRYGVKPMVRGR